MYPEDVYEDESYNKQIKQFIHMTQIIWHERK